MNFKNIYKDSVLHEATTSSSVKGGNQSKSSSLNEAVVKRIIKSLAKCIASKRSLQVENISVLKSEVISNAKKQHREFVADFDEHQAELFFSVADGTLKMICERYYLTFAEEFGSVGIPIETLYKFLTLPDCLAREGLTKEKNSEIRSKYSAAYAKFKDTENHINAEIFNNFKSVYADERAKFLANTDKDLRDKVVIQPNELDALVDRVRIAEEKGNLLEQKDFFKKIRQDLSWMDIIYEKINSTQPNAIDFIDWLKCIISKETEIKSNQSLESQNSVEEIWNKAIDEYNTLMMEFNKLQKDNKEIARMLKNNPKGRAALKAAGGILSGLSLALGAATYAFGALIPGGDLYASYVSGLIKNGRRLGKILSNAGSPLEDKKSVKFKKKGNGKNEDDVKSSKDVDDLYKTNNKAHKDKEDPKESDTDDDQVE